MGAKELDEGTRAAERAEMRTRLQARGETAWAGLDHFNISLPPGLDFGMGISFF